MASEIKADKTYDSVNRPAQYNLDKVSVEDGNIHTSSIQPIDYIERLLTGHDFSGFEGAMVKDIIKYVSRFPFKGNPIEDLEKAQYYLNRLIAHEKALDTYKEQQQETTEQEGSGEVDNNDKA